MRDLLRELTTALDAGRDCVYCAIVETRGSTPQKPGAAMLVFPDGRQVGTLGGGCVEAEVKREALRTLAAGGAEPRLHAFHLDDDYGWDDGLICGGRMTIVADALTNRDAARRYYRRLYNAVESGVGCTEAVIMAEGVGASLGDRYLYDAAGQPLDELAANPAPKIVREGLIPLHERPRPWQKAGVSYLPILPRITLLIVGGGHVGQAVAKLAADVDFGVWVIDDREFYASAERFPTAERRLIGDIGTELRQLVPEITPSVYALIVTRGHAHDEEALYHLATTPAGYVGMIGSKRKIKLIFEDLRARGIPTEALERVHAPLGIDIGSRTVPEIAVSIVAELIASRNLGKAFELAANITPADASAG